MVGQVRAFKPWERRLVGAEKPCYTENDVRNAIKAALQTTTKVCALRFAKTMSVSSTFTLPSSLRGVSITANPGVRLYPTTALASLFAVKCPDVSIDGVRAETQSASVKFSAFAVLDATSTTDRFTAEFCKFDGGVFVDGTGGATFMVRILDNDVQDNWAIGGTGIVLGGQYWCIEGNTVTGKASAIVASGVSSGLSRIFGNALGGGAIDLSAGNGTSILSANPNTGAKTLAAGDIDLDQFGYVPQPYALGSRTLQSGNGLVLTNQLQLSGSQRLKLAGTARLRIT